MSSGWILSDSIKESEENSKKVGAEEPGKLGGEWGKRVNIQMLRLQLQLR